MMGSPRICLERCDEDIDLLSELLEKSTDATEDIRFGAVSGDMINNEVDDLTSYLCRSSGRSDEELSDCLYPLDTCTAVEPCTSPSPSTPSNGPVIAHTEANTPVLQQVKDDANMSVDELSEHSECSRGAKSIVVLVPKSQPCMNKNAVLARENRRKKKHHMQQLEADVSTLRVENSELKEKIVSQDDTIEKLNEQVRYLKSVIANQSTLSALLKNIQKTSGVKLKSSFSTKGLLSEVSTAKPSRKNCDENQENELHSQRSKRKCVFESEVINPDKRMKNDEQEAESREFCEGELDVLPKPEPNAGVCLHVSGREVSLEFCATCSKMAASSQVLDDHSYVRSIVDS